MGEQTLIMEIPSSPRNENSKNDRDMGVRVSELHQVPIPEQDLEIVERKGLGHPDHICDAIMNQVSVSLSKEYLKRYGHVQHHNIDKALQQRERSNDALEEAK